MRRLFLLTVASIILFSAKGQTISPDTTNEYCPLTEVTFAVTIPNVDVGTTPTINGSNGAQVLLQPYSIITQNGTSTFKFKGQFADFNKRQLFQVSYKRDQLSQTANFSFKNIKSFSQGYFYVPMTGMNVVNAPHCIQSDIPINFPALHWWMNESPPYTFGTIIDYEYQLPANWSIGNQISLGNNWITATNNVTIKTDLNTGDGEYIRIRPKSCNPPFLAVAQSANILVKRDALDLAISASPGSLPCGATTPVTFTIVNNSGQNPAITGYIWNLGANNGWIYNGNPAPSSLPTATNMLTLIPVCGIKQNNISAVAIVSSGNETCNIDINQSNFSITAPPLSISGLATLCSGTTSYTLNGTPCNATNLWSISPTQGIVSLGAINGPTTTLTRIADGVVTLTASVASCGTTYTTSTQIHAGAYNSSEYTLSGNNGSPYFSPNQVIDFNLSGGPSTSQTWSAPYGWTLLTNAGVYGIFKTQSNPYPPTGDVAVSFIEPCGSSITKSRFMVYNGNVSSSSPYTISPNPSSSYITIACASLSSYCNIAAVQITNLYGTVLSSQSWSYTNQQVQMPVSFLQNGTYIAKIYNGTQWYSIQFSVQH